jgi:LPXTG-motif cell wall-anchored protein
MLDRLHNVRALRTKDRQQNQILSEIPTPKTEKFQEDSMKNLLLPIVIVALLVTLGFGQTPAPIPTADLASVNGCLSGSEGNYAVAEDGTTQTFKITSSAVDLKPHVGHDIAVTGAKTMATSSGPSDNSVAVTAVSMLSEHCASATASTSPATDSTPVAAETVLSTTTSTPAVVAATPAATGAPATTETTPVAAATPPAVVDPAPTPVATTTIASTNTPEDRKQLPNTSTSLPMFGLLGLGLLGLGWLSARSRAN